MFTVAALYKFTPFADADALRPGIRAVAEAQGVKGSLLLAAEGLNGTIAGPRAGVEAVLAHLKTLPGCADLQWKESQAEVMPFNKLKVRLKKEIVTMGQPHVDPTGAVGCYVAPQDWNALIAAPDVTVIDTRNSYEVAIGSFEGAVDPETKAFSDFPAWWEANKDRLQGQRIAMFCTGGIRCEKASNYLLGEGVPEVFHLQGGILKYLEEVPAEDSRWNGECYVFDHRVSVGHGLKTGPYTMCHACGRPVAPEAKSDEAFEEGVSCPACIEEYSEEDRTRFRMRQAQKIRQKA